MSARQQALIVLPAAVTVENYRMRKSRGQIASAHESAFNSVATYIQHALTVRTDNKDAAGITDQTYPMWSDGVAIAEAYPTDDPKEHVYLIVAEVAGDFHSVIGPLAAAAKLPASPRVLAISINEILKRLRADAAEQGVELPAKIAPQFLSAEYVKWREGIDDCRGRAMNRAFAKAKS
jgi:hypothetical protein